MATGGYSQEKLMERSGLKTPAVVYSRPLVYYKDTYHIIQLSIRRRDVITVVVLPGSSSSWGDLSWLHET